MSKRRKYNAEEKATIIRRHLVDKVTVAQLCEEYKVPPSVFYTWQKAALENLVSALESGPSKRDSQREQQLAAKVGFLEAKLAKKDNVIAEISAEYVHLKKSLGEP
jgi:transposase-like protein